MKTFDTIALWLALGLIGPSILAFAAPLVFAYPGIVFGGLLGTAGLLGAGVMLSSKSSNNKNQQTRSADYDSFPFEIGRNRRDRSGVHNKDWAPEVKLAVMTEIFDEAGNMYKVEDFSAEERQIIEEAIARATKTGPSAYTFRFK